MLPIIVLFIALLGCIVIYCKIFFEKDNIKTFILKIVASSLFLVIGVYSCIVNKKFNYTQTMVIIGLCMCMIGDIVIGLRRLYPNHKNLFILLGMAFFLLAHFTFAISFLINFTGEYVYTFALIIILWIGFVILLKYTKIDFGKFLIPCYLYILSASILFSIALMGLISKTNVSSINLFVGILLFIISDVFLCYTYYKKELNHLKLIKCISVITYFVGEALIAFSIYLY